MDLKALIALTRDLANQPTNDGFMTDNNIAQYINLGQAFFATKISDKDEGYFEAQDSSLGFIADQREYTLPDAIRNQTISMVERTDLDTPSQLRKIRFQDRERYDNNGSSSPLGSDDRRYYLRGPNIGIIPTPDETIANNLRLSYVRNLSDLSYGTVASGTTTTLRLAATPTAGVSNIYDDYYIGDRIAIISGAGVGQIRTISDYDASNRNVTIDTAWTSTPNTSSQYSLLSAIPEQYQELLALYAVKRIHTKGLDIDGITAINADFATLLLEMLKSINQRTKDNPKSIRSTYDGFEEFV